MDTKSFVETAKANPELAEKGQEALQAILARSATDREFRNRLLSDPRGAVAEFTGRDTSDLDIRFVENTATATIVLPNFTDSSAELSESELESVAGGISPTFVYAGYALAGTLIGAAGYAAGDAMR